MNCNANANFSVSNKPSSSNYQYLCYLGSLDFFMLMIADLRHDLEQLQARVFPNSVRDNNNRALPRYSIS